MKLYKKIILLLFIIFSLFILLTNSKDEDNLTTNNNNYTSRESSSDFIKKIYNAKKIEKSEVPTFLDKLSALSKYELNFSAIEGNFEEDTFILLGNDGSGKIEYGFSTKKSLLDRDLNKELKLILITSEGEIFSTIEYTDNEGRYNFNINAIHKEVEFVKLVLLDQDMIYILVTWHLYLVQYHYLYHWKDFKMAEIGKPERIVRRERTTIPSTPEQIPQPLEEPARV